MCEFLDSIQSDMSVERHATALSLIFTGGGKVPAFICEYRLERHRPVLSRTALVLKSDNSSDLVLVCIHVP